MKQSSRIGDLFALFLSFILACAIWVNAQRVEDPIIRRALQIPVTFNNMPENVRLMQPTNLNSNVLIAYEGPTSIVNSITTEDFSATIDLSQITVGAEQLVPIMVQVNNEAVTLDAPAPDSLTVQLEQLITREIPVTLEMRGSLPRGYTSEEALLEPQFITVKGIASDVNRLSLARVTVFLSSEDTQTKIVTPQPIFYDTQGRVAGVSNLELSHNVVAVTLPIQEAADFANKVISVNVVGEPAPGYRVLNATVSPLSVLVTGRPSELERPFSVQTEPIDVTGLTETFQTRVSLDLPEGITLDEVQEIMATIEIEPFASTKIFNRPIDVLGLSETLDATVRPESLRIVLFGPLPVLDALREQEVEVTVDVFGLGIGTHEIEPRVIIPPDRGLEIRSIQPALVTVEITSTLTNTRGLTESMRLSRPQPVQVSHQLPRLMLATRLPLLGVGPFITKFDHF